MFQSKVGGYLEEFLDRLQLLPLNVKRVLELVGDLDGVRVRFGLPLPSPLPLTVAPSTGLRGSAQRAQGTSQSIRS